MRQVDVTDGDVANVMRLWETFLDSEDAGSLEDLPAMDAWHIFEAEQFLVMAACASLGLPVPISVTFSAMDTIEQPCECEVYLFWSKKRTVVLSLGELVPGAAVRLDEYCWPGSDLFVKTAEHIKYVIWRMSLLGAVLAEGAPDA